MLVSRTYLNSTRPSAGAETPRDPRIAGWFQRSDPIPRVRLFSVLHVPRSYVLFPANPHNRSGRPQDACSRRARFVCVRFSWFPPCRRPVPRSSLHVTATMWPSSRAPAQRIKRSDSFSFCNTSAWNAIMKESVRMPLLHTSNPFQPRGYLRTRAIPLPASMRWKSQSPSTSGLSSDMYVVKDVSKAKRVAIPFNFGAIFGQRSRNLQMPR